MIIQSLTSPKGSTTTRSTGGIQPLIKTSQPILQQRVSQPTQQVQQTTKITPVKKVATGFAKFAARTGVALTQLATETLDFAGDFLASTVEKYIRQTPTKLDTPKAITQRNETADKWRKFYDEKPGKKTEQLKQLSKGLSNIPFIQPSQDWSKAPLKEKFTTRLPETIVNIGPGIVSSLGAYALNPTLGFTLASGSVAGDITTIAEEAGVPNGKAQLLGLSTGLVVGFLDKIVPDEIFSPGQKKLFVGALVKKMVGSGLKEAGTEITQEGVQLLVESTLRDDLGMDEVLTRTTMSGLGGLLGGAGARGTVGFINGVKTGDIAGIDLKTEVDEKILEEVTKPNIIPPLKEITKPIIKPVTKPKAVGGDLATEAKKYKSAEEFIENYAKKDKAYGMQHRPSYQDMPPVYDLLKTDMLPKDVYTSPDFSIGNGAIRRGEKAANESWEAIKKIRNKPDSKITVYRASPKNELNNGDWISLSKEYAKGEALSEGVKVHKFEVPARDVIFAGDDINEFGYWENTKLTNIYNKAVGGVGEKIPQNKQELSDYITKGFINEDIKGTKIQIEAEKVVGDVKSGKISIDEGIKKIDKLQEQLKPTNKATKATDKKIAKPKKPTPKKIVKAEPKVKKLPAETPTTKFTSRVFERLQAERPEVLTGDLLVDRRKINKELSEAADLFIKDKQKLYDIAMNKDSVEGISSTIANITIAEKALDEGNLDLYGKLTRARSIDLTRKGFDIAAERASVSDNSTARYVKELISTRLDSVGRKYLSGLTDKKTSVKEHATNIIDKKVVKLEETIKNKKLNVKTALELLEELTCL
jgi:hypothetical protein